MTALVCSILDPGNPVELADLLASGRLGAEEVVGIVGKVDGSGNANDSSRALALGGIREALRRHQPGSADDVAIVLSSGCAGLISPNLTVVTRSAGDGLRAGRGRSREISPVGIGRMEQVLAVADATTAAVRDTGGLHDVDCVLVKVPCLRPEDVRRHGTKLRTQSVAESMALANDAAALGVGIALGEIDAASVSDEAIRRDWDLCCSVAMVSAGPEMSTAEVLVLGNGAPTGGNQRIGHAAIRDPFDRDGVLAALASSRQGHDEDDVVQVFAKLILPMDDTVRGLPTSFFAEPSPASVAKTIGATLIGSVIGRSDVFVSGGERGSHQGPPDASPIAIITGRSS